MKKTFRNLLRNDFKRVGLFLSLLLLSVSWSMAQKVTVTGTVTGEDGFGIPGVNIFVKDNPSVGTVTDIDGNYAITLDESGVILQYSFIGVQTVEKMITSSATIDVVLLDDSRLLEDVVVVGYGSQKKETVVGSITQTTGEDIIRAGSVTTVSEALTGLLPGVSTMQAAGQPGSTAANILIRGRGSWTSSAPLYLVDGVERDFNNLDPNEIESISVLKDASATAVYGIKAANGVILVTTKTGTRGKPRVSFSANVGLKDPTIDTDYASDYATNLEYYNLAAMNQNQYDKLQPRFYIDRWRDPAYANNPFYQYTSFINTMFKTGQTQQYNLNISGGNDFVRYFTSFGYNYDGDIYDLKKQKEFDPRTYQHRYNWRTNLDFNFTETTRFGVKLSGDMTDWNGNFNTQNTNLGLAAPGGSMMQRIYSTALINAPAVYEDGRLGYDNNNSINVNYFGMMEREGGYKRKGNRLYSDFTLEQDLTKHLVLSGKLSYNYDRNYLSDISKRWNDAPIYYYIPSADGYSPDRDEDGNIILLPQNDKLDKFESPAKLQTDQIRGYGSDIYYEFALNYNQSFGEHNIGGLALFQRRKRKNGNNFPNYEEGWVGRVTYDYSNKYLFEANMAYNGNENFAPGNRFGFFPSLATGWVLSEEDFMKDNLSFIDFFKIRYSYGQIGSDRGLNTRFPYLTSYSSDQINMEYGYLPNITGNNNSAGLHIFTEGNPPVTDVTWETATKQNLGLEINTLKNRLRTTIDFFNESRTGILMQRRVIPNWYGNSNPYANIGETKNHGIDFEVNWNDIINKDLSYWVKANLSITENRIVNRDDPLPTPDYRKEAGKPIGWNSGYQSMGLMQNWDDVYKYTNSTLIPSFIPGDLIYNDYNADGKIDIDDMVPIGNPSYASNSYAMSMGVQYKNVSVTLMFNGMFDLSKRISNNYLNAWETNSSLGFMLKNNEQKDAWTPLNTDTDIPVIRLTSSDHYMASSSYNIRSSSFLRLRNVELKYTFPKSLLNRVNLLENFELYVNGNNLYTWQSLPRAFDPEASKLEVYPIAKRYNVGLRLSF